MGKQINYWMDYDSFLLLAQKALDLGCRIVKEDLDAGKVTQSNDIGIVTPYGKYKRIGYYFHLPEAGEIKVGLYNGMERIDSGFSATGNAVIEAGYSFIWKEPEGACGTREIKELRRARIYCITGYYDENGAYIPRPDCLTRVYNALARYVKKLAPCTEFADKRISIKDEDYGKEYEYRHKEYVTGAFLDMVNNEGYVLC